MDLYRTAETWSGTPGAIAPADGNLAFGVAPASLLNGDENTSRGVVASVVGAQHGAPLPGTAEDLGPNNERLEDVKPELVHALRELVRQYRQEGIVARRHEIRRIRQARLFWQGLQYAWWNPNDMNWHLPFEQRFSDDRALEEMPRYQFVTNFYQGFGLSFIAVLSQDVPSVRFYPQSAQSLEDISAARAASDVAALIEQNNHIEHLLTSIGYFLWTDGKLGAYVRYVADGQRFGFREENVLEALEIPLGEDVYVCPQCGKETGEAPETQSPEESKNSLQAESDRAAVVGAQHAAPLPLRRDPIRPGVSFSILRDFVFPELLRFLSRIAGKRKHLRPAESPAPPTHFLRGSRSAAHQQHSARTRQACHRSTRNIRSR